MTGIKEREVKTEGESVMRERGTGIAVEIMIGTEREIIEVMSMIVTENTDGSENVIGTAAGIAIEVGIILISLFYGCICTSFDD